MEQIDERVLKDLPQAQYVYVIKDLDVTGFYKIGMTKNISQRIIDFGVKLPFRVGVIRLMPTSNARWLEAHLHKFYSAYRVNGEWFNLSDEQIKELLSMPTDLYSGGFVSHEIDALKKQIETMKQSADNEFGRSTHIHKTPHTFFHERYTITSYKTKKAVVVALQENKPPLIFYTGISPYVAESNIMYGIGHINDQFSTIEQTENLIDLLQVAVKFAHQLNENILNNKENEK